MSLMRPRFSGPMILILMSLLACKTPTASDGKEAVDVYVAGYETDGRHLVARVWVNGAPVNLSDGSRDAVATAVQVVAGDVYAAGFVRGNHHVTATYWKNGIAFPLTDGSHDAYGEAIVVSGADIYVAGREANDKGLPMPRCWKNGRTMPLDGLGTVSAMAKSGDDLYLAGNRSEPGPRNAMIHIPTLWENGTATELKGMSRQPVVKSMALAGDTVYVAGRDSASRNGEPRYCAEIWKNGAPALLTDGSGNAEANAIAVSGADIYVAGYSSKGSREMPTYWKNGKRRVLARRNEGNGFLQCIAVDKGRVFAAGFDGAQAVYWRDGIETVLSIGGRDAFAWAICVVPHTAGR